MIETVSETKSTNTDLVARVATGEQVPEGYWLIADRQIAGKGRQGRSWVDAPGNFMGSTVVRLAAQDPAAATLSFVAAMATYETILSRVAPGCDVRLKWPNDVLTGGAKLAGILLERCGSTVVVGIGVNLAGAPELAGRAARHLAEFGPAPGRDVFARELVVSFSRELDRWRQFGLEPLFGRWLAAAHPVGSPLSVHRPDGDRIAGVFEGLASDGALCLRLADGSSKIIYAGDVSLGGS